MKVGIPTQGQSLCLCPEFASDAAETRRTHVNHCIPAPVWVKTKPGSVVIPNTVPVMYAGNIALAILPGGHGDYIGEICSPDKNSKIPALVVDMIEVF